MACPERNSIAYVWAMAYSGGRRRFVGKLIRWKIARREVMAMDTRTHTTPSRCDDLDERFFHARDAFSAPRFKALYRMWKQDGDRVLADADSRALGEAVTAGAGRVETLELGHRYGHLSPLVNVA
jgi:hypothetical protein